MASFSAVQGGDRIDRFELVAELASGGMASVFLARVDGAAGFRRLYAIKCLHPHLATQKEFVDMFLDEARLAARIHHPNVVPILEIGTSDRGYYLVMEYVAGETAAYFMSRGAAPATRLPVGVAVRVVLDALAGLHAAHELLGDDGRPLDIVHRDVSPQNILVGVDGTARITDFGIARAASRLSTTGADQLKGKLAYMAPEQARRGPVDRRLDVWAMGVVFWEMLTASRLFKAESDAATLSRVLSEAIPTPRDAGADVPEALQAVCMRALQRDPEARFATAAAFADELERVARSNDAVAAPRDLKSFVDAALASDKTHERDPVTTSVPRSAPVSGRARAPVTRPGLRELTPHSGPRSGRGREGSLSPVGRAVGDVTMVVSQRARRILTIDDSATVRKLIRVFLMGMDFEFVEHGRADHALAALPSSPVDLVIVDVNMPGMDGLTFLREVRASADPIVRAVPVVLLTSDSSTKTRQSATDMGASGFALKPVTSSNLRETVTSLLGLPSKTE